MRLRAAATVLAKLALSVFVVVGAGVLIILPLRYPITSHLYQPLPTIVPIAGAACSAIGVAILLRSPRGQNSHKMSFLSVAAFSAVAFVLTWYLTMFIILNIKGS